MNETAKKASGWGQATAFGIYFAIACLALGVAGFAEYMSGGYIPPVVYSAYALVCTLILLPFLLIVMQKNVEHDQGLRQGRHHREDFVIQTIGLALFAGWQPALRCFQ